MMRMGDNRGGAEAGEKRGGLDLDGGVTAEARRSGRNAEDWIWMGE